MTKRQSNLELLRIVAMLMIVTLHFFNGDRIPTPGSSSEIVYFIYESLAICGVNLFVMLTGYFSLRQDRIRISKILDILLAVTFWEFVGFMLCVASGTKAFQLKELIRAMFPIIFGGRWFVKAYIILVLLMPFLNIVLCSIEKRSFQILLAVQFFLFCIWPFFLPNPPFDDYGYSFIHFITLYFLIGYVRLHVKEYPSKWLCLTGYFFCFGLVLLCKIFGVGYEWAYNSPFVIAEALFLFLFFVQLRIRNGWINRFASCAFGVYLVHTNAFFSRIGYEKLFYGSKIVNGSPSILLICVPVCAVFFYLLGFALESTRKALFRYTVDPLLNKIQVLDLTIVKKETDNQ